MGVVLLIAGHRRVSKAKRLWREAIPRCLVAQEKFAKIFGYCFCDIFLPQR
jgi:hypothetical protein